MAAFSASTNILSPPHQHRCLRLSSLSSNFIKSQIPVFNCNKQLNRFNFVSAGVSDISAATTTVDMNVHNDSDSASTSSSWVKFAENVSGEWDGFGADFTAEGEPIELPESVVPEAYREWGVKVFDWQTQCPTLALSNNNSASLIYKTIKLLPTVGCEADADAATVYTVQEMSISAATAFAYHSSGSYVALWPSVGSSRSLEVEYCLIHPDNKESRVRIIQALKVQEESSELKLVSVKVFVERWYGPFRNGDQLGGCSLRDSAFAATEPLKASQICGVWQGTSGVADFRHCQDMIQHFGDERGSKSIREEGGLVFLPKQLWCSLKSAEESLETSCEVGWVLDGGRAISSKCIFSTTTDLKEIVIATETASLV